MTATVGAIRAFDDLLERCSSFIARMHALGLDPDTTKTLKRLFSPGEAAEMVGRDRTTLGRAESLLDAEIPARDPQTKRRVGYTLTQIQAFRNHFGTLPWRDPRTDPALFLAVQNFKGGTGKSTTTVNLAQYLALQGYRVLVEDNDPQGTTTGFFGYVPDRDLKREHTVFPYLNGEQPSLEYAIRKTHWPNIDLIPACMGLADIEIGGVLHLADVPTREERVEFFRDLRYGLEAVSGNYDVVLLDTPPALGVMALMVLMAADALVIPTTAKMPDFASTVQFLRMGRDYISKLDPQKGYYWRKVLVTQFSRRGKQKANEKSLQEEFVDAMRETFGDAKFKHVIPEAVEIQSAAATFGTPYEQEVPNRRVLTQLNNAFGEIEIDIMRCWPSKQEKLIARGLV